MNASQITVEFARIGRAIHLAGTSWGDFRKADDPSQAKRAVKDTRNALERALRSLGKIQPKEEK